MNWSKIGKILLFAILALLFLSELVFSSLSGLFGDTASLAASGGLTTNALRIYLVGLAVLNAIGGLLAIIALKNTLQDKQSGRTLRRLSIVTILYAAYQLLAGLFLLGSDLRGAYIGIAVTYALLAGLVWFVARNKN